MEIDIINYNAESIRTQIERIFQNHKQLFWVNNQKELLEDLT